jgi:Fe-Mn family superoxide dismutase
MHWNRTLIKLTMEIHHGKHHQAYVTNLNKALEGKPEADSKIEDYQKYL